MRIHCIILLTLCILSSCGTPGTNSNQEARLQHSRQINTVEVMTLERSGFAQQLLSNGKLVGIARSQLLFGNSGPLSEVNVSNGMRVRKGTVLAKVSRPDIEIALRSAEIALEKTEMELFDYLIGLGYPVRDTSAVPPAILSTARMKTGYASAKNNLDQAKLEVSNTILCAPFSGRVANVKLRSYDYSGNDPFCTIIDDSAFDVDFTVMESEYASLSIGQPVMVIPYANNTITSRGRITTINPTVDENGQITVRARVSGGDRLLDGMNVKVVVEQFLPDQLVIPRSAVVVRDNLDVVFTYSPDGKAHWNYIVIVASNADSYAVEANTERRSLLKEGDQVIISGNLNLADGSEVVLQN